MTSELNVKMRNNEDSDRPPCNLFRIRVKNIGLTIIAKMKTREQRAAKGGRIALRHNYAMTINLKKFQNPLLQLLSASLPQAGGIAYTRLSQICTRAELNIENSVKSEHKPTQAAVSPWSHIRLEYARESVYAHVKPPA